MTTRYEDEDGPMATMDDAHREWHRNTGIPMGTPGCPQDACHPPEPDWDEAAEMEWDRFTEARDRTRERIQDEALDALDPEERGYALNDGWVD